MVDNPILLTTGLNAFSADIVLSAVNIPDGATCRLQIFNDSTGNSNGVSDSSGLTWTESFVSTDQRIREFTTTGNSGSSAAVITITHTGPCGVHVINTGNAAITPVAGQIDEIASAGGANKTLTLPSAITAGNILLGWIGHTATRTTTSDENELSNFAIAATATTVASYATTGADLGWGHSGVTSAAYGVELEEAGGGATPLLVDDINQSQSIDQPTLTQAHSLVVNDVDQGQTIDQPTLTQANILSTNDLDQSQTIDSPALTQAHVLSVDDITQSQTIDNVTLAIAGALLVNDLTQSQIIDLANIIQSHILSVNGLSQSQTIDQPSLSAGITVNDITQAQSLDLPTLTQANVLSVDSLTQAQILDNIASGAIVIGFHEGEVSVFSAYNGIITATNAHTGEVKVFNAVDIT